MDSPLLFGEWLRQRRDGLGLTRKEFAKRVGCSVVMLRKIEGGERRPSGQIAELMANALDIPSAEHSTFVRVARGDLNVERLLPPSNLIPRPDISSPKTNLPILPTPLIGRQREVQKISSFLSDPQCRLLTLVGPGGIGKTRLAIETAIQLENDFEDGTYFVPLAPVNSARFIVPIIANSIGFAFQRNNRVEPKAQLLRYLKEKGMLLLVDNVEHLLKGTEIGLFSELLAVAPNVKLLITSREPLNIQAEWVFDVQGLPIPNDPQTESVVQDTSIELFIQRARRAHAGFGAETKDFPAIAHICRLVDGTPLGIELAAAWVRTLSCEEIAHEIELGMDFLHASARDLPARHRSMRAVFEHSWKLLDEEEQAILSRLSIFRGGFEREAAEQVAGATLSNLDTLVTKSLIRRSGEGRYDLHEVIRQYTREQLIKSRIPGETAEQHFEFFLALAEEAYSKSMGSEQIDWLDRLDENLDNLRAALEWSLRFEGDIPSPSKARTVHKALRLTSKLSPFWERRSHWTEGRDWLKRALAQSASLPGTSERADALNAAALLATEQADTHYARQLAEENLTLSQELENPHHFASAHCTLGVVLWKQKKYGEARAHCEEGLALFRQLGNLFAVADTLHALGHIAINQDDYEAAQSYLDESLSISRELENKIGIADVIGDLGLLAYLVEDIEMAQTRLQDSLTRYRDANLIPGIESALNRLGDLARYLGDYEKAGPLYKEALSLFHSMGDMDEFPSILHNLGYIACHRGDYPYAMELFKEGLAIQHRMNNKAGIAECLLGVAGVLAMQGQAEKGAQLFGAAEALRHRVGASLWPANRVEADFILAHLREALNENTLTPLLTEGQSIPIEQLITEQLDPI